MHSFGLGGERVGDAEITAQALAYLLGFKDQAVALTGLPSRVCELVTLATAPGVAARRKQLQHLSAASAYEERSPSTKVPRCPGDSEHLTIKSDRGVVPVLGLDACAKELVAGIEPIAGSLTTYAALRKSRMSTLLVCSTVRRPYPRVRSTALNAPG
jgi:hypothetical protein